jgi:lipopolysaccharide biosynthesis glycosyltransferase
LHITHDGSAAIREHLLCKLGTLVTKGVIEKERFRITASVTTNPKDLNDLFGQCATARFTLPDEHPTWDALIYLDVDTLVMEDIGNLWHEFSKFDSSQWCALAEEQEHNHDWKSGHDNWYVQKRRHYDSKRLQPYKNGMNSGVLLWNLTRYRAGSTRPNFVDYATDMLRTRTKDFWMPDQDALNTYFRMHPTELYTIPCRWNYRLDSFCYEKNDHFHSGSCPCGVDCVINSVPGYVGSLSAVNVSGI